MRNVLLGVSAAGCLIIGISVMGASQEQGDTGRTLYEKHCVVCHETPRLHLGRV
jgi:cytochrome c5